MTPFLFWVGGGASSKEGIQRRKGRRRYVLGHVEPGGLCGT